MLNSYWFNIIYYAFLKKIAHTSKLTYPRLLCNVYSIAWWRVHTTNWNKFPWWKSHILCQEHMHVQYFFWWLTYNVLLYFLLWEEGKGLNFNQNRSQLFLPFAYQKTTLDLQTYDSTESKCTCSFFGEGYLKWHLNKFAKPNLHTCNIWLMHWSTYCNLVNCNTSCLITGTAFFENETTTKISTKHLLVTHWYVICAIQNLQYDIYSSCKHVNVLIIMHW